MKIDLVHPAVYVNPRALTALRPGPPLGLAYVAAALRRAGHDVRVVDAVGEAPARTTAEGEVLRLGLGDEEIVARLRRDVDAVGIGNMWSFSWPAVRSLIARLRRRHPEVPLVCGGEHFTGLPRRSMQEAAIDFIVLGEGEETAVALFDWIERGRPGDASEIPGVCWRRGDEIVVNPRAARTRAVDDLPWPAWDLFDLDAYDQNDLVTGVKFGKTVPILATRGCPYQCTYCSSPTMWTTRWYARDPVDVADEIEHYVRRLGATNFPFQDLTAIIKRDWIIAFCKELLGRGLDVTWQLPTGTRCEVIDEEVAPLLFASGGRSMSFAPESGSQRTRALVKKKMTEEKLLRAVRASVAAGINVSGLFVIGFPHDTEDDLRETARLVRVLARMGVDDIAVAFFYPIPGTELYDQLVASGRIRVDDRLLMTPIFVHDRRLTPERNYCAHLSAGRLCAWKYRLVAGFYLASWTVHPAKPLRRAWNLVRGREASKMDTFLAGLRRRLVRGVLGGRAHRARRGGAPSPAAR